MKDKKFDIASLSLCVSSILAIFAFIFIDVCVLLLI